MHRFVFLFALLPLCSLAQEDSLNCHSLFRWTDTTLVPSDAHFNTYNEIWGVARDGREYAIIGTTAGTHIFDVTDVATASEVAFVPGAYQGAGVVHRDYHDYGDYLYMVCDEGNSTLQIADLSYLPDSVHVVYDADSVMKTSHNIFIDSATARMYAVTGIGMGNQLDVYDLSSTPENPPRIAQMHLDVSRWPFDISRTHDLFVRNDTAYINAEGRGLFIVDFDDPLNPVLLGSLTDYPQNGYNHSGWLTEDGNTYILADENHGLDLKILDVSNLSNITILDTLDPGIHEFSLPHNVLIKGPYAFVSYYFDGLRIYDISDPANPVETGFYDTSTRMHMDGRYEGNWGVYPYLPSGKVLLSDMQSGLWVVDCSAATPKCPVNTNVGSVAPLDFDLSVWPNPTADRLVMTVSDRTPTTYELLTLTGQQAASGRFVGMVDVALPKLSSGLYVLRVQQGNAVQTRKISIL